MSSLPLFKTGNTALDLFQTKLKSELDPFLANILFQGLQVQTFTLNPGINQVNHLLGRTQLGWFVVDVQGPAQIWRTQPFNNTTLTLNCSASAQVSVSLWMF